MTPTVNIGVEIQCYLVLLISAFLRQQSGAKQMENKTCFLQITVNTLVYKISSIFH